MLQPIRNQIVFKPFLGDEKSVGGIIVPENARGESDKGVIVAVGQGTRHKPMLLEENTVAHRVHAWGEPIEENGERFYIMEDSAIIALN